MRALWRLGRVYIATGACEDAGLMARHEQHSGVTLVAALYVNAGHEQEFEQFETHAARIMSRYGGHIDRRVRCTSTDSTQPYEIHVVAFPDESALARYRSDGELASLGELRSRAIRATTVWRGVELPEFKGS